VTAAEVRDLFTRAGVRGWLHARPVDPTDPAEVAVAADEPVVMASVYKLPVLVAFCRAVDAGELDPREPVRVEPSMRTAGETGLSVLADPVTMSRRDLARSMITVSDNAAGDALLADVGLPRVARTLADLGLTGTHVDGGTREVHETLIRDTNAADLTEAMARLADNDHPVRTTALDPLLASATTARDMTALLAAIWTGRAASAEQCRFMRTVLGQQVWPHRLASGFAYPGVRVAGKTGSLGPLRHEVGVVEHRHEPAIAVAVFTTAARADRHLPRVDAAIGQTARAAVTALRPGGPS
jgi:beta-lactamase class A